MNKNLEYPLVTVVTVTRNRASLLGRAIESVLSQTYWNIEYIIIDGASTDNTEEVVNSFNDKRIKYIQQKENLLNEVHDLFVDNSKGEYFAFLDDDDEYFPDKIMKQYNAIKNTSEKIGLVYCWMDYYDSKTNELIKEHHPTIEGNVYYHQIEKQSIGGTPTLLIKRDAFVRNGGWNMDLNHPSDWEMLTRFSRIYKVMCLPEVLVKVNINHKFERQSTPILTKKKLNTLISFHKYYLEEFSDGFNKYPRKRYPHFWSIAGYYAYLGEMKYFIKYSLKSLGRRNNTNIIIDLLFFMKRFLRCLINSMEIK